MKVTVSVPDPVFKEAEKATREFRVSRSEFFTIAIKDYLKKIKSRKLLEALNETYAEEETEEEFSVREKSKKYYSRKILKGEA